jgi:hypothetical protein
MRAGRATGRLAHGIALASDALLDFVVLAFAAWTVIYHVCLLLGVDTVWAAAAQAVALLACAWVGLRRTGGEPEAAPVAATPLRSHGLTVPLVVVNVLAALAAATLFAFTPAPWAAVWLLWIVAAGAAVLVAIRRTGIGGNAREPAETPGDEPAQTWPATLAALVWAVGLATLSLFLVNTNADDTQYVHLSSWVAAHGEFPLRDTLFSDQAFPAIIFPPISSFEALAGTVARGTGIPVPDLLYLVVTPVASALSVLALWRLLRTWSVRMVGVALSVALVFLLMDAHGHRTLGNLFISRIWQGKIVFLAVLVPLLFVALAEYSQRPSRRRLLAPAAAGVAAVGLSSTGVFLVPVIAAGCLAPLALRSLRQAAAGFLATAGYPLGAGVVTLAVGGRNAEVYTEADLVPGRLVHLVFGDGLFALVGVTAVLVGPILVRRTEAAGMTAATALLVGCLYAPLVPVLLFRLTGLGQVQWRWTWAVPTAALVGLAAAHAAARIRAPALRALPVVLVGAALVAWGTPLWSSAAEATLASAPAWKRPQASIEAARDILAHARPGEVILAPRSISQTILVMSGTAVVVAPRVFYTRALGDVPGGHPRPRLVLQAFSERGLAPADTVPGGRVDATRVARALGVVRVDIACIRPGKPRAREVLVEAGYSPAVTSENVVCLQAPGRSRESG